MMRRRWRTKFRARATRLTRRLSSRGEARASAASGRFRNAHELYQQAAAAALRNDDRELAAQWMSEDAEIECHRRRLSGVAASGFRALELGRDNFTLERCKPRIGAVSAAEAEALAGARELTRRFSSAILTTNLQVRVIDAIGARRRGDLGEARCGCWKASPRTIRSRPRSSGRRFFEGRHTSR